jgi:hypothetical protein
MTGDAAQDEQIAQDVDDVGRVELAADPDCQTFAGELVDRRRAVGTVGEYSRARRPSGQ